MNNKSVLLKQLFKAIRNAPPKAIELLQQKPDLAKAVWKKANKWIEGSTALHWAAHEGHQNLVKKLLALGADVNADKGDWWCRPIDWAADSGRYEVVQILIEAGATLGGDKWSNCTPLHVVAQGGSTNGKERSSDYQKTALALLKAGADINAIAKYGGQPPAMTPLDDALQVGNKAVQSVLQQHGGKRAAEL